MDKQEKYLLIRLADSCFDSAIITELEKEITKHNFKNFRNIIIDISKIKNLELPVQNFLIKTDNYCRDEHGILILVGVYNFKSLQILPTISEAIDMVFLHEIEKDLLSSQ